jgi:hypothetical protein
MSRRDYANETFEQTAARWARDHIARNPAVKYHAHYLSLAARASAEPGEKPTENIPEFLR